MHTYRCAVGCPYLQKSLPNLFSKRYVIPIYKKMHFPEFQSFPSSSSFGESKFKNTKEISKNTKEKCWFWNFCKFWFEIFFFSILNFMAAFLRSQRFFWYPYCHMILCHMSCQYASKYVIFDIYGILWRIMARHLTSIHMSIWVSKEAWEPKETSHKV